LFWLGRYAERSQCIARLLRCIALHLRQAGTTELACLFRLHACLNSDHSTLPKKRSATALDLEREVISLFSDAERADSLPTVLDEVHRVGGNVQERLSTDMMRLIGKLAEFAQITGPVPRGSGARQDTISFVDIIPMLTGCLELLTSFSGMERENITRGSGWLFLTLGRRIERAIYTIRQLREVVKPFDEESWPLLEYLLEVADSSMTYRSRYFTTLEPAPVLDVLMADETNPR